MTDEAATDDDRPHDVLDDTDAILAGLIRIEAELDKIPDGMAAQMAGLTVAVARHIQTLRTELIAARRQAIGNDQTQDRLAALLNTISPASAGDQSTLF